MSGAFGARVGGALIFGAGTLFGIYITYMRRLRRHRLPPPSECPVAGVSYSDKLPADSQPTLWIFFGQQFMNLDFYNNTFLDHDDDKSKRVTVSYPVRLHASAGYMRAWGTQGPRMIGDQTTTNVTKVGVASGAAHDMVGVLVPFRDASQLPTIVQNQLEIVPMSHFDWLGWADPPAELRSVHVLAFELKNFRPPSYELPIVQTHLDVILEAALRHGEAFAAEWLDSTMWWVGTDGVCWYLNEREHARRPWDAFPAAREVDDLLAAHPAALQVLQQRAHFSAYGRKSLARPLPASAFAKLGLSFPVLNDDRNVPRGGVRLAVPGTLPAPARCKRREVTNFLFGFGSIIQTASRAGSDPKARDAAPCRIKAAWGYVREWNFQASTAQICALGLRRVRPGEAGATINGVLFPAPSDLSAFDARENGYMRVEVRRELVEMLSWHVLPASARVYVYVPYAPSVAAKYGNDPQTGLPRASGPTPPEGLLPHEAAGLGLTGPSLSHPILQSYVDVCLSGCLEYGEDFTREFLRTTFLWSGFWLNERSLARRPWLHQAGYAKIDKLLREECPVHFPHRKLESEYAVYI